MAKKTLILGAFILLISANVYSAEIVSPKTYSVLIQHETGGKITILKEEKVTLTTEEKWVQYYKTYSYKQSTTIMPRKEYDKLISGADYKRDSKYHFIGCNNADVCKVAVKGEVNAGVTVKLSLEEGGLANIIFNQLVKFDKIGEIEAPETESSERTVSLKDLTNKPLRYKNGTGSFILVSIREM
ncbi:MAG: hypothetical protein ACLQDH_04265 [Dissulfurispiraceae bacterium]